ncbi:hypothetical protein NB311A_04494 [Nitrobacter sp. Nb-311A]|nr:hypothetical protein NB311A_04494 [Nitrobacter sp. Nb-311A]
MEPPDNANSIDYSNFHFAAFHPRDWRKNRT